jgi:hypothetical protein
LHPNVEVCPFQLKIEIQFVIEMTLRISVTFQLLSVPKCALLRGTVTVPYALLPWHHCHRPLSLSQNLTIVLCDLLPFKSFYGPSY